MPKFNFQLAGVLRYRKNVEQEKQRQLGGILTQVTEIQNQIRGLNEELRIAGVSLKDDHLTGKLDMAFIAAHRRYQLSVERRAMGMMQKIALLQRQADDVRKQLVEAAKQRKMIEKLRETQFARWRQGIEKIELAELDDVGMQLTHQNRLAFDKHAGNG